MVCKLRHCLIVVTTVGVFLDNRHANSKEAP